MTKLGIFGTSGFAREVADIADLLGYKTFLIAKDKLDTYDSKTFWPVITENELEKEEKKSNIQYALGIGENKLRDKIVSRYSGELDFVNLIHPSATFGKLQYEEIQKKKGVVVCAGVRFTNNIVVGDYSIFNLNSTVGHDVIVEEFVNISPGALISGNVWIKRGCWIGTGAVINQGKNEKKLEIGSSTVIGSGSVVTKDCDEYSVYVGAPARRIK